MNWKWLALDYTDKTPSYLNSSFICRYRLYHRVNIEFRLYRPISLSNLYIILIYIIYYTGFSINGFYLTILFVIQIEFTLITYGATEFCNLNILFMLSVLH